MMFLALWIGCPKCWFGFSPKGGSSSERLVAFNFIRNNFVRLYWDSCHISVHLKKNIKIGEFLCSHFNIEDGRKKQHFLYIVLYYFKKIKNTTETQKKICAVYEEGTVTN